MQADHIWRAALGELQLLVNRANFNTWLKDTRGIEYTGGSITVAVPTVFIAEWLKERLLSLISRTVSAITGHNTQVQFVINSEAKETPRPATRMLPDGGVSLKERQSFIKTSLNPRYTFDSFIPGDCNRLPYTAAMEISGDHGCAFNPLFIYGGTGTGKTHLLHSIGHTLTKSAASSLCISAEQFTNEFIVAIRSRKAEEFRYGFSQLEVLLIDDIQFISGKTQTQECLFHIINDFLDNNRQVVITSDRSPKDLENFNTRLMSRIEGGLLADLHSPDRNTCLAILELKTRQLKSTFDRSVLEYLAANFHHNVRELEGSLLKLITQSRINGSVPDLACARNILGDMIVSSKQCEGNYPSLAVINAVAAHFNITQDDLISRKRDLKTSRARHVAMYLLRNQNHCSLAVIGSLLGGRDHTTVIHGCGKVSSALSTDTQLILSIKQILMSLKSA